MCEGFWSQLYRFQFSSMTLRSKNLHFSELSRYSSCMTSVTSLTLWALVPHWLGLRRLEDEITFKGTEFWRKGENSGVCWRLDTTTVLFVFLPWLALHLSPVPRSSLPGAGARGALLIRWWCLWSSQLGYCWKWKALLIITLDHRHTNMCWSSTAPTLWDC